MIEGLRYKLRMMGVQVEGPTDVYCDNESVEKNLTKPKSILKKKQRNAIAYHQVCEVQATGIVRIAKEDGETNLAEVLTKCLLCAHRERADQSAVLRDEHGPQGCAPDAR